MKIYELIECELDENNFTKNEKRVMFFDSIEHIFSYLTKDGRTGDKLSIIGHSDDSEEHIKDCMLSSNATIKVHTPSFERVIGYFSDPYDTYYFVRTHEVRCYGFFKE